MWFVLVSCSIQYQFAYARWTFAFAIFVVCLSRAIAEGCWDRFVKFSSQRWLHIDKRISLKHVQNLSRGLYAEASVPAGTVVAEVPELLLIRSDRGAPEVPSFVLKDEAPALELLQISVAVLRVARERRQKTPVDMVHSAYIDCLPTNAGWSAAYFDQQHWKAMSLQSSNKGLAQHAGKAVRALKKLRVNNQMVSHDDATWAVHHVLSRQIGGYLTAGDVVQQIVPAIDFANHNSKPNSDVTCYPGHGCALITLNHINAGDEIHWNYARAPASNATFLTTWGFAPPSNPYTLVVGNALTESPTDYHDLFVSLGCSDHFTKAYVITFSGGASTVFDEPNCIRALIYIRRGVPVARLLTAVQHSGYDVPSLPSFGKELMETDRDLLFQLCADLVQRHKKHAIRYVAKLQSAAHLETRALGDAIAAEVATLQKCVETYRKDSNVEL